MKNKNFGKKAIDGLKGVGAKVIDSTKNVTQKAVGKTVETLDVTGDDKFDIKDIIVICLKVPICVVKRDEFLEKELSKHCVPEVIKNAINSTPLEAGVTQEDLDVIAKGIITSESAQVTSASFALGYAAQFSLGASIPTDLVQYYVYTLRVVQKLIYLYGFPEIIIDNSKEKVDDEILNFFAICLGVMYSVVGASDILKIMLEAAKENRKLFGSDGVMSKPIMHKIFESTGKNLTRKIVTGIISNFVPVIGGAINGGITYVSFQPNCNRLRKALQKANNSQFLDETAEVLDDINEKVDNETMVSVDDHIAKLREYKALLDEGILTQEEFDLKKKQLLDL